MIVPTLLLLLLLLLLAVLQQGSECDAGLWQL
jgi:hypothetical protein